MIIYYLQRERKKFSTGIHISTNVFLCFEIGRYLSIKQYKNIIDHYSLDLRRYKVSVCLSVCPSVCLFSPSSLVLAVVIVIINNNGSSSLRSLELLRLRRGTAERPTCEVIRNHCKLVKLWTDECMSELSGFELHASSPCREGRNGIKLRVADGKKNHFISKAFAANFLFISFN